MTKWINLSIIKRIKISINIFYNFQNTLNKVHEILKNNILYGVDFVWL